MNRIDIRRALLGLGVCGVLSSLTTVTNILLPRFYTPPADFAGRVALLENGYYMARQYILLVHPFLTLTGALGILFYKFAEHPGKTLTGFVFAFAEKITEFFLGTTILFVVLAKWVKGYGETADSALQATLRGRAEMFYDYLGGAYFLLWVTFTIAAVLFGLATRNGGRLERVVSVFFFITAVLTVLMLIGEYGGQNTWVRPILLWCDAPALTTSRLLAGWMLIQAARRPLTAAGDAQT
ncbi:MAG TPA: hypothetical protein VE010_15405 [Thermoanaerobaculia bacterium]|nr:hypothetical protein [Thermoanaerobaculia bacterium]